MTKYIDEFIKLPLDKLSQRIVDMTYLYNKTLVPKTHYKKCLQQEVVELIAQDTTFQLTLLNAVVSQLKSLKKESPQLFIKAIYCLELGIKTDNISVQQLDKLNTLYEKHHQRITFLSQDIVQDFNE